MQDQIRSEFLFLTGLKFKIGIIIVCYVTFDYDTDCLPLRYSISGYIFSKQKVKRVAYVKQAFRANKI